MQRAPKLCQISRSSLSKSYLHSGNVSLKNRSGFSPAAATNASTFSNVKSDAGESHLNGKKVGVKANIVAEDSISDAASRLLSSYSSPYDATVVRLLRRSGAIITGNLGMDEFGMGSHSQFAYEKLVQSPFRRTGFPLSPGGSSGGSAIAVATGECWASLGTDTGGSVRLPAAYTGVLGFKPSYGRLSRWGVIQYANSLDTVGILGRSVSVIREMFQCLDEYDHKDPTSLSDTIRARFAGDLTHGDPPSLRVGIPLEYNIAELSQPIREVYLATLKRMQVSGHTLIPVSLPSTRKALSAYYVLAPAEASSNLAKYDGVRYGLRAGPLTDDENTRSDEINTAASSLLYTRIRGSSLGAEVKRRILLGSYTLSSDALENHFLQAQRVRRLVQKDFDAIFATSNPLNDDLKHGEVDVLLTPTAPTLPPTTDEVKNQTSPLESYMADVMTVPASLAGLPAISIPVPLSAAGIDVPHGDIENVGMQVIGQFGDDQRVLGAADTITKMMAEIK